MAATIASQATITIRREQSGVKAWEAVAGKLKLATSISLDTLVETVTNRHGGVLALINTAHVSKPSEHRERKESAAITSPDPVGKRTPAAKAKSTKRK